LSTCLPAWNPHAGERRSVTENRQVAIRRLRLLLATEHRCVVPLGEIGSDLWKSRLQGSRIVCNPDHADFPALLAEAMDVLFAMKLDAAKAAIRLDCTASQLVKLIKDHPPRVGARQQRTPRAGESIRFADRAFTSFVGRSQKASRPGEKPGRL
jgi:hypothetical protein